jgi:hypothetical protein
MFILISSGIHQLADGLEQAPALQNFTNKNAPAMMGALITHHRKIYVWV